MFVTELPGWAVRGLDHPLLLGRFQRAASALRNAWPRQVDSVSRSRRHSVQASGNDLLAIVDAAAKRNDDESDLLSSRH